jgi:hypothetical protein
MRLALERSPELSHRMLQAAFAHASKYVPSRTDCRRLSLYGAYDWREVLCQSMWGRKGLTTLRARRFLRLWLFLGTHLCCSYRYGRAGVPSTAR